MIHAHYPWDSYDAQWIVSSEAKLVWMRQHDYSLQKQCLHPDCNRIIRNKATVCKEHREWHRYGDQDPKGVFRRHHKISAMIDHGVPARTVMALARRGGFG